MTAGLVAALFVSAALVAAGVFIAAWRRDLISAMAGIPLMFGGAGAAFVAVTRFATRSGESALGQEAAALIAVAALAAVALGTALAGREGSR